MQPHLAPVNQKVGAHRCKATEFSERGQLFMTPLIQSLRTIMHLGETVPEAEQARRPWELMYMPCHDEARGGHPLPRLSKSVLIL